MGHHHRSRREILKSIPVLTTGSLLLPLSALYAERPNTQTPGIIRGKLRDASTGKPIAAKIRVTDVASGEAYFPAASIKTMPQRTAPGVKHYFYAKNSYEIAVPPGRYQIEVVRGISHNVVIDNTEVGAGITHMVDFSVPVFERHACSRLVFREHTHALSPRD